MAGIVAPITPDSVSPVDGASVLGRGLSDGPGAARSLNAAALAAIVAQAGLVLNRVVVTATTNYTPSPGTVAILGQGQGAGGGGAGAGTNVIGGGGGAGSSFIGFAATAAWGPFPVLVTIGAGGAGSTGSGADGGVTSIGTVLILNGGLGGVAVASGVAAGGGRGAGTTTIPGGTIYFQGSGAPGAAIATGGVNLVIGGAGGRGSLGPGGTQALATTTGGTPGSPGEVGSGGGAAASFDTLRSGGNGGRGEVTFWEVISPAFNGGGGTFPGYGAAPPTITTAASDGGTSPLLSRADHNHGVTAIDVAASQPLPVTWRAPSTWTSPAANALTFDINPSGTFDIDRVRVIFGAPSAGGGQPNNVQLDAELMPGGSGIDFPVGTNSKLWASFACRQNVSVVNTIGPTVNNQLTLADHLLSSTGNSRLTKANGTLFIDTSTANDQVYRTTNVERLRILAAGGLKLAATNFAANGAVGPIVIGSTGPTGLVTPGAPAKWLTFQDSAGVASFIPVWQ